MPPRLTSFVEAYPIEAVRTQMTFGNINVVGARCLGSPGSALAEAGTLVAHSPECSDGELHFRLHVGPSEIRLVQCCALRSRVCSRHAQIQQRIDTMILGMDNDCRFPSLAPCRVGLADPFGGSAGSW